MSIEILGSGLIAGLTVLIGLYVLLKSNILDDKINEIAFNIIDDLSDNTDNQRKIYSLGVLIGAGAKQGFGIGKGSGKFSLEALLQQAIGSFFGNVANQPENRQNEIHNKELGL